MHSYIPGFLIPKTFQKITFPNSIFYVRPIRPEDEEMVAAFCAANLEFVDHDEEPKYAVFDGQNNLRSLYARRDDAFMDVQMHQQCYLQWLQ